MCILLAGIFFDLLLIVVFYAANGVFEKGTTYEVTYATFPHYLHAYELMIALSTGSLGLIFTQIDKIQKYGVNAYPVLYATWAFILSIVLSLIFILFFIRDIQVSKPDGNPPLRGISSKIRFCVNMFFAISALMSFVAGFAYAAESMRAIATASH